ncbi:tyrosine-type recombinase/integrase [Lysinibacillus sp. BPa_S21]|uniref:tyrosine-type recombinase/integrase n=1 Tax=Lysinibacillus sp. BPa_S21 TaxID=2932478 RepID=UPI0020123AC9|nr:tyrosine-type recombinase/integrase [Lysinibacillus sp. BPa_S21]MCL1698312.1 tyrosine-type recombinase/integrase [Lysinibacillus sp. BPa_S21]
MTKIIELMDDFKIEQQIKGRKQDYIEQCHFRLNKWRNYVHCNFEIDDVEEVKAKHIKQYILHAQKLGKERAITINNALATLRVFYKYLVEEEFIDEFDNPMRKIESLKEDRKVILTFNDDEVSRILNDVAEETYNNVRDKLMLIMLFDTGIRVSELCSIKNSDIARRHILIHGKGSKERMIYISKTMRRYMRKYEELKTIRFSKKSSDEIEEYYFLDQYAQKLHRSRINKILKEHCKNAGVRKEVRCSPHDCRHYFAQKQLRNGIDVYSLSQLLGHFDTQMTTKYLRGLEQEDVLEIGRQKSPLNNIKF